MRTIAAVLVVALVFSPVAGFGQAGSPPDLPSFSPPSAATIQQRLRVGVPFAYSLCLGRDVDIPVPGDSQSDLISSRSPCGGDLNPTAHVSGGNPPYHFRLDSGSGFPPMGVLLDANGVLRGTPSNAMTATFRVCAVDLSENTACQTITLQPQPAVPGSQSPAESPRAQASPKTGRHGPSPAAAGLIGGVLLAGAAVAVASAASNASKKCAAGTTDCADGHCCPAGNGCCGVYGGSEKCCSSAYPHYCPSTDKCYATFPSCNFSVCGGVVANARGIAVGRGPSPGALRPGDPTAAAQEGVPPTSRCESDPR